MASERSANTEGNHKCLSKGSAASSNSRWAPGYGWTRLPRRWGRGIARRSATLAAGRISPRNQPLAGVWSATELTFVGIARERMGNGDRSAPSSLRTDERRLAAVAASGGRRASHARRVQRPSWRCVA